MYIAVCSDIIYKLFWSLIHSRLHYDYRLSRVMKNNWAKQKTPPKKKPSFQNRTRSSHLGTSLLNATRASTSRRKLVESTFAPNFSPRVDSPISSRLNTRAISQSSVGCMHSLCCHEMTSGERYRRGCPTPVTYTHKAHTARLRLSSFYSPRLLLILCRVFPYARAPLARLSSRLRQADKNHESSASLLGRGIDSVTRLELNVGTKVDVLVGCKRLSLLGCCAKSFAGD